MIQVWQLKQITQTASHSKQSRLSHYHLPFCMLSNNPKRVIIIYRAASPARWLLHQNEIHSSQTLVHSWVSEDNLKPAGWAFAKSSAELHLSLWFVLFPPPPPLSLCMSLIYCALFAFCLCFSVSLCLLSPSHSTSSAGCYVCLRGAAWPNMRRGERERERERERDRDRETQREKPRRESTNIQR